MGWMGWSVAVAVAAVVAVSGGSGGLGLEWDKRCERPRMGGYSSAVKSEAIAHRDRKRVKGFT